MQAAKWVAAGAALAALAGCATGPDATAQGQCQFFSRTEGLEFVRIVNSTASGPSTRVEMQVKDALGRPFNATCVNTDGKVAWAEPLPSNVVRRWESDRSGGSSSGAPPAR